jgi:hypothetical protein
MRSGEIAGVVVNETIEYWLMGLTDGNDGRCPGVVRGISIREGLKRFAHTKDKQEKTDDNVTSAARANPCSCYEH